MFSNSRLMVTNSVLAHLNGTITHESSFSKIFNFTEKERNITKYTSEFAMTTMCCRLRKSTEHHSDSNIKHMSILVAGKDSSDSSTKDDNFINVENRGGPWKVSAGVFEIFLIFEKYFRCNVSNQKRKIDVQQMVSSLMIYFIIRSHFTNLQNFANEESEDGIALNLLESMLTLYLPAITFKYVSLQKEAFKLETRTSSKLQRN